LDSVILPTKLSIHIASLSSKSCLHNYDIRM